MALGLRTITYHYVHYEGSEHLVPKFCPAAFKQSG